MASGENPGSDPAVREDAPAASRPPPANAAELWRRFLDEVYTRSSLLYAQVASGRLQRVKDGELVIAFPSDRSSAREETEKPENRRELQNILARMLNQAVTLTIVTVQAGPARQSPAEAAMGDEPLNRAVKAFFAITVR
jgi:hypothetical protein